MIVVKPIGGTGNQMFQYSVRIIISETMIILPKPD